MDTIENTEQSKNSDNEEASNSETESVKNANTERASSASSDSAEDDEKAESNDDTSEHVVDSTADVKSVDSESNSMEEDDGNNHEIIAEKEHVDLQPSVNIIEAADGDSISVDSELRSNIPSTETESDSADTRINATEASIENPRSEDSEPMEVNDSESEDSESNSNLQSQEETEISSKEDDATKENDDTLQTQQPVESSDKESESNQNLEEIMEVTESESEINEGPEKLSTSFHHKEDGSESEVSEGHKKSLADKEGESESEVNEDHEQSNISLPEKVSESESVMKEGHEKSNILLLDKDGENESEMNNPGNEKSSTSLPEKEGKTESEMDEGHEKSNISLLDKDGESDSEMNESHEKSSTLLTDKEGESVSEMNENHEKSSTSLLDKDGESEYETSEAQEKSSTSLPSKEGESESELNQDHEKLPDKEGELDKVCEKNRDDKESVEKEPNNPPEESMEVIESETTVCETDDKIISITETTDDNKNKDNAEQSQVQAVEPMEINELESEESTDKNKGKENEKTDTLSVGDKDEVSSIQVEVSKDVDMEAVIILDNNENKNSNKDSSSVTETDVENDESILPDTEKLTGTEIPQAVKNTDSNEQYIVTNYTEKSSSNCMQCSKSSVPKYICTFEENTSHICSDICLDDLKNKKPGKVTVRGLRVKMFASEDQSRRSPVGSVRPTLSSEVECVSERCKHCSRTIASGNYFSWNTYNYCNGTCLGIFQKLAGIWCVECKTEVPENLMGKYSVRFGNEMKQFCKNACLLDHKKGQKFCSLCQGHIQNDYNGFCSKKCYDVHNSVNAKKVGSCAVCLKEKVVEIEFENDDKAIMFCGEPCFVAYKFVNKLQPLQCEFCKTYKSRQCMTCTFSFGGISHYLCSKDCQKLFIITNRKIVHCLWCNVKKYNFDMIQIVRNNTQFVMCSLNCYNLYQISLTAVHSGQAHGCDLCHKDIKPLFHLTTLDAKVHNFCSAYCLNVFKEKLAEDSTRPQLQSTTTEIITDNQVNGTESASEPKRPVKKIVVVKPRPIPKQRNMSTMCKPYQITKSINCRPKESQKGCQTDEFSNKFFLPVPVPIYVPTPAHMYTQPVPMPVPFPLPIPVPIFIPTTRKSATGILKEINKIKNKVPADPLEAELLMMAEMVAGDKKDETDSESEDDTATKDFSSEQLDTNNSFGEDVLQMALKMASDFEEPVDLEGAVSATTISAQTGHEDSAQRIENIMETKRRSIRQARQGRRKQQSNTEVFQPPSSQPVELEKPDANMCLKYTFGVNAWKQWVTTKNLELQKTSKRVKLFKTEILQLTADELNFSLCLFVKEVRKPNGTEYAPDTIYYLCLGIQQYLYENGRIDNIFCDTFYEKFTDCLNEVCRKFSLLYNESQYIVTRVEEEHLWESKQLGAHSPLVLLNTLMFFNTKHFSLTTVDEHLQLSFSHIMKHWKRNPNQPGARNVLLRFYPPQTSDGPRKKKVYEQQENEDNPLRCPVKLYEFYMSKCPESVKTRNDVFYLQPERSCVPDSPVWYSTMALGKEPLDKMLNRVKMVKEINIALLTT